ncbi:MAG TPA: transketolase C-terminal domain-containing protein, partial [Chloroflexota bacterium]
FDQMVNAFNLADKYQMPVVVLSDTVLATRTQSVPRPDVRHVPRVERLLYHPNGHDGDGEGERFRRYLLSTEDGVSPMSVPGQRGGQYVATGLEHNELGRPRYSPEIHSAMTRKRFRKLEAAAHDAPPPLRVGDPGAEVGIVTWGSTAGHVVEAVELAHQQGLRVDALVPKMVWPLPDGQLRPFIEGKRVVVVPEVNYSGQFAELLAARYKREFVKLNVYGGAPFRVDQIVQAISEVVQHV